MTVGIINLTMAEYMAKVPLEVNEGGGLPNNSILFKSFIESPPQTLDCSFLGISDECDSRLDAWNNFATENSLSNDWNNLSWSSKSLTNIPSEPYPLTNVFRVAFNYNQLPNIDGLSNLTSVSNFLSLNNNNLKNLNGLINLTNASYFDISNNQITNIDGLKNLSSTINLYF